MIPLSSGQQRLWFLHRTAPGTAYNVPLVVRLSGNLDRAALATALSDVVDRHEPLRTVFAHEAGVPFQEVLVGVEPWMRVVEVDQDELAAGLSAAAGHVFDLAAEAPLRATLFAVSPSEHVLLLLLHHIAVDGWSMTLLLRDLGEAYRARVGGVAPRWTPLPVQYADYALWQRELLAATDDPESLVSRQLEFWRLALAGLPQELSLPVDRPRPAVPSWSGGWVPFELDATVHQQLLGVARRCDATLMTVLQAGMAALLTRLGAGDDIPIGTPVAGRADDALNDLVGFFVNTLVLRVDTSGDPSFAALVGRVREAYLTALANQDVPFDQVVEAVNPARSASRHPLFQVIMALDDRHGEVDFGELRAESSWDYLDGVTTAKFDLSFSLAERWEGGAPGGIEGKLEFAGELFDRETARAIAARFVRLLTAVAADPQLRLGAVEALAAGELDQLLRWGSGRAVPAVKDSVVGLFEAQVARSPDTTALVSGRVTLTYAELDAAANRLAHRLVAAGVGPECPVVMVLERSASVVVSMLGVLKAGGFFVPLPSGFPPARMARVIADLGAPAVVTDRALRDHPVVAGSTVRVVVVDDEHDRTDEWPSVSPGMAVDPDQLMYVMYTSGSTGEPKGVAVSHRSVVAFIADTCWQEADRRLVFTHSPHAFDPSIYELWAPLLSGGELVIAPPGPLDAAMLEQLVAEHRFSSAVFAAALFDALSMAAPSALSSIPLVWTGGDVVSPAAIERLREENPSIRIGSGYGATEATVISTWYSVEPDQPVPGVLPIGRPMDNVRVYVLDGRLRPVPAGVPGELFIGGSGLARGYWHQPGLTAERFVADPFGPAGSRMYRTGDIGRWSREGCLEFLGRVDDQVKVRGHRVEPGEVEAVLHGLPGLRQAAVIRREDQLGDHRLVAYVAGDDGVELDPMRLRDSVAAMLPDYMVPAAFVVLDALPVTVNGKLDRTALPAPDYVVGGHYRAPRSPQEEVLCGIFAEVLGVARVGVDDNFFDLGGHSLLAARLVGRIRAVLGAELDLRTLFDTPTVAGLVGRLTPSNREPLTRLARPERVPLSSGQQRLWFLHRSEPGTAYNVPLVVRLAGVLDRGALLAAVGDVVERHEPLRTTFPDEAGFPYQHVLSGVEPWTRIVSVGQDELAGALVAAAGHVFELTAEAPLRVTLFAVSPSEHVLLLLFHHIAVDGWSTAPLLRDLGVAYSSRTDGNAPNWPPLPVQYADYALWQRELLIAGDEPGSLVADQLEFWRTALAGMPQELNLPADRPRPAAPSWDGGWVPFELDAAVHAALASVARSSHVTLFMVLQAALAALLTRLGAGTDVPLGTAVAGRADEATNDLVGFFVNTLVLRTDTSGDPTFTTLLGRVRERYLAALAHQDVPFDQVVEAVNPVRSTARHPLFQVIVALDDHEDPVDFGGVRAEPVSDYLEGMTTAKFDLTFGLVQHWDCDAPGGIEGKLEFAGELFDRETARAIADRFVRLLTAVAVDPGIRISQVAVLEVGERDRLLRWGNGPEAPVAEDTVVGLFEAQVARSPRATALVSGRVTLTYADLDVAANRLAHRLVAVGVGPECPVVMVLQRSASVVVSMLAVLKVGGFFVPLPSGFPPARMEQVIASLGAPVLVTDRALRDHAPVAGLAGSEVRMVMVDDEHDVEWSALPPGVTVDPDQLMYVMYTSGSTGVPKGVAVSHRSVVAFIADTGWKVSDRRRVLTHSPHAFDPSVYELWAPLLCGGELVIAPPGQLDASTLNQLVAEHEFSSAVFAAALFDALSVAATTALSSIPLVWTGGDVVSPAAIERLREENPSIRIGSGYGATEATVISTWYSVDPDQPVPGVLPIGRPMDNVRIHVLDDGLQPAPVGVPGELFIGGSGLARGYWGQPGLTAERFVADPFGPAGSRMYRTGDVGRWSRSGCLEFLGRVDDQVKVRGHRVEPGEIVAVLLGLSEVRQAAVILREDRPGDHRLVAYVVPADDSDLDTALLRQLVASTLPDYMVPAGFVLLGALPVTVNGKLDRTRLPAPDYGTGEACRAPRTPQEEVLCGIFAEVLGATRVGVDDSFFDLGGHSLLAARLIARVRAVLGAELDLRAVFDTPTVAALTNRLTSSNRPELTSTARPARVPLSSGQQRLWFLHRSEPGTTYNVPLVLRLSGALDRDALLAAVGDVVERHEPLRTVFPDEAGEPYQRVLSGVAPWTRIVEVDRDELDAELAAGAGHVFDLVAEAPMRATLFAVSPSEHVLLLLFHHIAVDGWSTTPLLRDLGEAYSSRVGGEVAPQWASLPIQYADYALWQRELLAAGDDPASLISHQLEFWRTALAGMPQELNLPVDRPRPAAPSWEGGRVSLELDASVHTALTALARSSHVTLFMVLQAALAALLTRLGAGDDVPLGTAVAGRTDEASNDLVGFFVNTLVLRTDTSGDPAFTTLLGRVRETCLTAMANQDVPFDRVVEAVNPARSASRHPLFQVTLSLNAGQVTETSLGDLRLTVESVEVPVAKFDLGLGLTEKHDRRGAPAGIDGGFEYATDLFDRATVAMIASKLVRLLEAVAADPDLRVGDLPLLSEPERHQLLVTWNDTARPVPETTLPELFEAQVARTPHAVAVQDDDSCWSYTQLDERANQVAHWLTRHGVRADHVVGVALPRSTDLAAAIIGILKVGAGYVPLDLEYPADRLDYMKEDAGVRIVLGDAEMATSRSEPTAGAWPAPKPDGVAYVIYTSGSTGRPKGVANIHRAVVNRLLWMQRELALDESDVVVQKTPSGFDVSVWELFWPLFTGARLRFARPGGHRDPEYLRNLIVTAGVTTVHFVPSMLAAFVAADGPRKARSLRRMLCGGEALPPHLAGEVIAAAPWCTLYNLYGPAEAAIDVTWWRCGAGDTTVSIGRPIDNIRMYVLDGGMRPVPVGVPGELFIAGTGLARGYRAQPGLTAERFVADPFGPAGSRMYRTGDVGRWNRAGCLEYLGRTDHQVKIRGNRVEPGEVEAVLHDLPEVSQAAVVLREDQPGDHRLVAYVVSADDGSVDPLSLRQSLASVLPAYMLPAAFVVLDELPLSVNGKLDRAALPAPTYVVGGAYRAPRSPREEVLCGIFAEVLGATRVGVDDSFFDLGGHSLLAARLIGRVRAVLGAELDLRALFDTPTVAGLVGRLTPSNRPVLTPMARPVRVPLSSGQQRLWFVHRSDPGTAYNVPLVLRLSGALDRDALLAAVGDVVERHEPLRTVFSDAADVPFQQVLSGIEPWTRIVELDGDELGAELTKATGHVFDLATDAPVRASLFAVSPSEHVLLLLFHHIAVDGWSMSPLLRDLGVAYRARAGGQAPRWTPLPVHYADYALWQRELLGEREDGDSLMSQQLEFWRSALAGLPQELRLPADRSRPAVPSWVGGWVLFELDAAVHQRLRDVARHCGATLFMVLQAGLAALLTRLGAGTDIPIGTPAAGRTDDALNDLVGFFVNTLVLRADVSGDPSFTALVGRVREAYLAALANQDVQFDQVVEAVNPARSASRHPLFQVMLALQNNEEATLDLDGVTVDPSWDDVEFATTAKFDLSFGLLERWEGDASAGIEGNLEFAAELFDRETARVIVDRFVRLLAAVAADPRVRVGRVDVLGVGERDRLLEWGSGPDAPVVGESVVGLFEAQVERGPHAPAVVSGMESLSYAELNARANRLAWLLIGRGVGPEDVVGLVLPHSPELVVAMLAVLKAGAAYLTVDVDHPAERVGLVLRDAEPVCVLAVGATVAGLPGTGVPVVVLDDSDVHAVMAGGPAVDPGDGDRRCSLRASHPAYVLYTSGSTGRPKGVLVEHRSVVDYLTWTSRSYSGARGVTVLHTPVGFDLTVTALYTPLVTGGCVVLSSLKGDESPVASDGLPFTFIKATPSHLPLLADAEWDFAPDAELLLGGEALSGEALQNWRRIHPDSTVWNVYGPTEATVNCTEYRIPAGQPIPAGRVPIGRPQGNARMYVLDDGLQPAPAGVPGELYIAGPGLARGYRGRPGLTAERFVADPFGPTGSRMYRTGDIGRWNHDGCLEFLGRADDQVKVRGHRVEPGEIEAVLLGVSGIRQAVVILREDQPGDHRLVAYVVGDEDAELDTVRLRRLVGAVLPDYMVPAGFVPLDALPLTVNGKLDRTALPAPDYVAGGACRAPCTPREEVLCEIFAEVLGVARVGVDDSFFDLGGHSLLAIQLIGRVRVVLGVEIDLRTVFDAPTVAGLLADRPASRSLDVLLRLGSEGAEPPLFCVHPALGMSWCYSGLVRNIAPGRPVYGLQTRGLLETDRLPGSVEEMAEDYLTEIRSVQPHGPYHLLGWSLGGLVAHAIATRLRDEGEQVALLALMDSYPLAGRLPAGPANWPEVLAVLCAEPTATVESSLGALPAASAPDDVAAVAREHNPVLASLAVHEVTALTNAVANHLAIARRFVPATFDGDVVFFRATEGKPEGASTVDLWRRYVTGRMIVHDIDCAHLEMTDPVPLTEIGSTLASFLGSLPARVGSS